MRLRPSPYIVACAIALCAIVVAPPECLAFVVQGTVINGTTGEPLAPANILIVNPSGGMMVEKETQTIDDEGHFEAGGLDINAPVHLLRVNYKGINYTEMVRYEGTDPVHAHVVVYEPTTSWEGVRVSMPHVVASRRADTLHVDQFIQVTNATSPPRTVFGDDARFKLFIPEDRLEVRGLQVMSLGVPLTMSPMPTDEPGIYTIAYPLKPGLTQINLSFGAPYADDAWSYIHTLPYDMGEMTVITEDRNMRVVTTPIQIERIEDIQGFAAYRLEALEAGTTLKIGFEGGSPAPPTAGGEPHGGVHVTIVPSPTNGISLVIMAILAFVLLALFALAAGRSREPDIEQSILATRKEELLDRLAKLDDLFKTGTLSDQIYQIKRRELVNDLAQIYYRTQFDEPSSARKKGAARVQ